jgi:hypothetical protein
MAYQYPEIRSFKGLFVQANSFTVPDGAMEEAENVVIVQDNTITKLRGRYEYFDAALSTLNNLFTFQSKLLALFATKISYFTDAGTSPNFTGSETVLTGETVAVTAPRVGRSSEANGNLYFTTDNGVLKLEAYNSVVRTAGVPPGLDIQGTFLQQNGAFPGGTAAAYRVLFGRRDNNQNLLLSAPGDSVTLTNATDVGVSWSRTTGVVTMTTTNPHYLSTGMVVNVSASTGTHPIVTGPYVITVTGSTTFTFTDGLTNDGPHTADYNASRIARLEFSIPSEINTSTDGYFYQIYRTDFEATTPFPNYKILEEVPLTASDITDGVVFYDDDIDESLLTGAAQLYTNPNSREGELQANTRPPKCDDITTYRNCAIYANCTIRNYLDLSLISTTGAVSGDFFEVQVGTVVRRYIARTGVGNQNTTSESASFVSTTITVNYTAHGLAVGDSILVSNAVGTGTLPDGTYTVATSAANSFTFIAASAPTTLTFLDFQGVATRTAAVTGLAWTRASNVVTITSAAHGLSTGMQVYVSNSAGGTPNVASGTYTITVTGVNTFTIPETAAASSGTLDYQFFGGMFQLDTASSLVTARIRNTAQGLVKASNRDVSALVYAAYTSGITDTPGKMRFSAKGFTGTISVRANSSLVGELFSPTIPSSFSSGTQVSSLTDTSENVFYSSKVQEPEAVPIVNSFTVGIKSKKILRMVALRDSVIIIKEDGVFRLNGDTPLNFDVTALDQTIFCVSASSVAAINNQVVFLSNQGLVICTESTVTIISRTIELLINPIVGKPLIGTVTGACGYESDRTYRITTIGPNDTNATECYIYNVLNDTWTTSSFLFTQAIVGPSDTLFMIGTDNIIYKERKNQNRIDYCGQNAATTVVSVGSDLMSVVLNSPAQVPVHGDVLEHDSTFDRIDTVVVNGANYDITFKRATSLVPGDTPTLYASYESLIKMAPFHAGVVGRSKQFAQTQLHLRAPQISELEISYAGGYLSNSESVMWDLVDVIGAFGGWGALPWGFFGWGLSDGISSQYTTEAAAVIRTYVPRFAQRNTFIQAILKHKQAGESIDIQALSFAVRAYNERVSK